MFLFSFYLEACLLALWLSPSYIGIAVAIICCSLIFLLKWNFSGQSLNNTNPSSSSFFEVPPMVQGVMYALGACLLSAGIASTGGLEWKKCVILSLILAGHFFPTLLFYRTRLAIQLSLNPNSIIPTIAHLVVLVMMPFLLKWGAYNMHGPAWVSGVYAILFFRARLGIRISKPLESEAAMLRSFKELALWELGLSLAAAAVFAKALQ